VSHILEGQEQLIVIVFDIYPNIMSHRDCGTVAAEERAKAEEEGRE
jgi:hypothetical protein